MDSLKRKLVTLVALEKPISLKSLQHQYASPWYKCPRGFLVLSISLVQLSTKTQFHTEVWKGIWKYIACSIKTSEQTWNQQSVYIFASYLQVLTAISSCLFPGSLACHTVLEKAHEEIQCPLTLQFVANLKLFTLALTCTITFTKVSCFSSWKKTEQAQKIKCYCHGATHYGDATKLLSKGFSYPVWP